MSGSSDESYDVPLPPRGPGKPKKTRPAPETGEPTTFRPNPRRSTTPPPSGTDPDGPSTFRPNSGRSKRERDAETGIRDVDPGKGPTLWERIFFGRVGSGQLATFCRQFAAYLNAGVDISKALANLQRQFAMTALGPVIGRLQTAVKRGDSFAESVAREPQAFDALFVGMIRVAEARGGIPETLRLLSRHYENRQSLLRQVRSAMIYPIAVIVVASGVVALITIWLLPMFASLLKDVARGSADLPLPSRVLMAFSDFMRTAGWLIVPFVLIGTPLLLLWLYRTRPGKAAMDRMILWVPVFGSLVSKIDTTRFARTLSALLNAGVDVGSSMELTSDVLHLDPFRRAVRDARAFVLNGEELSEALDKTRCFGPDVIAVVESGEETGKLPESLDHLADDYQEQVAYMVRNMGQLVQPLLLIVLGGVVLFIILAVFLPYLSILTNLAAPH
jgi:type II secretory pathway component PulF